ncbi:MAG: Undecaprenyl-phosphate 4-deoxy-4-formamido-L-arabinose transferase [Candidatus Shapirobacteria bacterium GW2011_GWE1_38_10]|uniref:Undecaprenyl-phosphate 4-deoxy-4-formamido-L-arabinose transferase n=1 Tax=Candidatus Shapirobacteria bacterium GW2011_GWE1_38_10 TaxID=1618488 RepID=A0A0G0I054_9BACT|nr:MAG: Undecaprenyl-phosphate 4-deoxy-4-formamido-L-arabinose transferase [Candidatus Shapirobacteria bacterium GW2011_GWE1_38_10]
MNSLSIIIPAYNEDESLPHLIPEIKDQLKSLNISSWEIIVVDDGSKDRTSAVTGELHNKDKRIKLITFRRNEGKSQALQAGFDFAGGEIVITMDADGQDDPREIGRFIDKINEGFDLVTGWKINRKDSFIKNQTSKIYNYFTNLLVKTKLHDSNCGFKAYKNEVVKSLNIYGELHRYIPALAVASGFSISEISVHHRKREYGVTKFGPGRFIKGGLDLITVAFITKFKYRPLHMFGGLGLIFSAIGFIIGIYLSWLRFGKGEKIGDRPLLLLAILMIIIGIQITMSGLIGELITSSQKETKRYQIKGTLE